MCRGLLVQQYDVEVWRADAESATAHLRMIRLESSRAEYLDQFIKLYLPNPADDWRLMSIPELIRELNLVD